MSEVGRLTRVAVRHARDAFVDARFIATQWKQLNFTAAPDLDRAVDEYDRFLSIIRSTGARIDLLPRGEGDGLDSIYVRDPTIVCGRGVIFCNMGKPQRAGEPGSHMSALQEIDARPAIVGAIHPPGHLEGGDVVWLDSRTVAVGCGYRTNEEGIHQLRRLLGDSVDELLVAPLPHWRGSSEVLHLMSLLSPVDRDLAVVYSPLMPVPFRERLEKRGMALVEVPDAEFETMGANVLALAPRRCLMLAGNPRTRAALEKAGAEVLEYEGLEISLKGAGGPTCLTRPLTRE
jgi:N-dimethylarginine dimethylaminohydrolase